MIIGEQAFEFKIIWSSAAANIDPREHVSVEALNHGLVNELPNFDAQYPSKFSVYAVETYGLRGYFKLPQEADVVDVLTSRNCAPLSVRREGVFTHATQTVHSNKSYRAGELVGIQFTDSEDALTLARPFIANGVNTLSLVLVHEGVPELMATKAVLILPYKSGMSLPKGAQLDLASVSIFHNNESTSDSLIHDTYKGVRT